MKVFHANIIIHNDGTVKYEILEDVQYRSYVVPKGFISDGATVPKLFWSVFPPVDIYFKSCILHDWLVTKTAMKWKDAADVFYESLLDDGVSKTKALIMSRAVRVWGFLKCIKRG